MDITNIPQNLTKALEQKSTEQLAALSRVLNLALGKTVMASVVSTEPITAQERQELLKQTSAALAQLNQLPPSKLTPVVKQEIVRLLQQQNLIQSPELKWINLTVNNRPLLTYSSRPLVAGQTIPVQLQSPQKLVLMDMPDIEVDLPAVKTPPNNLPLELMNKLSATTNKLAGADLTKMAEVLPTAGSIDKTIKATLEKSPANLIPPDGVTKTSQQQKINLYSTNEPLKLQQSPNAKHSNDENLLVKKIVGEQLRNILPYRDMPNTLLSAAAQLRSLPAAARLQLFTPSLEQALKSVAEKIRSPEQLSQPKVLVQTLKNSGVFFESSLNKQSATQNPGQAANHGINNIYSQDVKGALLTLLNSTTQELNGPDKPVSSEQTIKLFQNLGTVPTFSQAGITLNSKYDITQALGMFVQQLMQKPVKEMSNKELRTQLLVLLQQHSLHSLAKIQLQQLHSLNHETDTRDTNTSGTSWQFEIPVRHHNDLHQLHMRIDREWIEEKSEPDSEKGSARIKQWSVTLRFDLPTLGEFCAQLTIVDTQVSATLWAEREKTFTEVREHVEGLRKQLEGEGINVKFLQCMRGMPPQKPMALSYSLIDIST
jgi:hypothetical protein